MSTPQKTQQLLDRFETVQPISELQIELTPKNADTVEVPNGFNYKRNATGDGQKERLDFLKGLGHDLDFVAGKKVFDTPENLIGNIENYIGMAQTPIGLAGPIMVNGSMARGDFYVPLATTEGALVASYNRGMKACRIAGGITSICISEGVQRSPFFKLENMAAVGRFIQFIDQNSDQFHDLVAATSRHAQLTDTRINVEGNNVILTFEYATGDAAGQNMVTICTDQICKYIFKECGETIHEWYIESNYSGDKKATAVSLMNGRGKKVSAEIVLPRKVVEEVLKTTPELMARGCNTALFSAVQSGSIGSQGHVANGLAALYLSCGQDIACIAESSIGVTRFEVNANGDLYVAVTLPALIVGTVGGGTGLPTQKECLQLMGCTGKGSARKFAEICAAVALAGELSIAAAMTVDHFTSAHKNLGRKK